MTMFVMTRVIFSVFYDDKSSARQAVEDGHAWGVIHFEEDFSTNLFKVCVPSGSSDKKWSCIRLVNITDRKKTRLFVIAAND